MISTHPADSGGFERSVERRLLELRRQSLSEIEAETTARRLAWLEGQRDRLLAAPLSPRRAFELLFLEYMGLASADLPVLSESDAEITWSSKNPCVTLEACRRAGLDTRVVCKGAYQRSTQAFLSFFDPCLRFLRDYREMRPHAVGCRERIVRIDVEGLMRQALGEARASLGAGNKGYGAAVALGERLLAVRHDTAAAERDPSLHAEVNAVRDAARALGSADLTGCVLVSTCEPCPMCSSLAVWAELGAVFFGASIEATAALGKGRIRISAREIAQRSPVRLEVVGGILEEECLALYR
ncbi:MAG TPA: nucleoside deaminase [Anaeromyxobacter sp.]|nr:nucleoside deaminase [Anaeromyxobacter sp.]